MRWLAFGELRCETSIFGEDLIFWWFREPQPPGGDEMLVVSLRRSSIREPQVVRCAYLPSFLMKTRHRGEQ